MNNKTMETRVFQLIYAGLIALIFSLFLSLEMATTAIVLQAGGALAVLAGIVLIVLRSRRADDKP